MNEKEELRRALREKIRGKQSSRTRGADEPKKRAQEAAQNLAFQSGDADVLNLVTRALQKPEQAAQIMQAVRTPPSSASAPTPKDDGSGDEEAPPDG